MTEALRRIRVAYRVLRHGHLLPEANWDRHYSVTWHLDDGNVRTAYEGKAPVRMREVYEESFRRHEVIGGLITVNGSRHAAWGTMKVA